ncbi:MAG TPA: M3 family metallopeptidase [Nitrososphaeraceae archaeon]|nr:M3 family metallopeptidase [Nitrososphaeraceae archaeon]
MDLKQWCQLDEQIYIAEMDERYKQHAGLSYNEQMIGRLAEMRTISAETFVNFFSQPRELFLSSLENIADSSTKKLELKLYNLRNEKIISSRYRFARAPVNWSTWRQFNSIEKDPKKRKHVFDEFISKTRYISPVIKERFDKMDGIYHKYSDNKLTPLGGYLENEKISYSHLRNFVKSMGRQAKRPFQEALDSISKRVLGRKAEYYDDFYFFRNRVYADLEKELVGVNPTAQVIHTLATMQFNLSSIHIDMEQRKNKYPSPICFFVQVPNDIRVLYKSESPYFDLQGCYHEMGHALHASSISAEAEYWNRYGFSMGIAEIFSIFLERLTKNRKYLSSLGIKNNYILEEIEARSKFMDLFFVTFYTANSLMKAEFWHKKLSIENASDLYARLIKEYTGFEMPGEYWMLHHILPDAIMYVPSYLIAAVRAVELDHHLQDRFGEKWWTQVEAGKYLREIIQPGAAINLSTFSRLDSSLFMNELIDIGSM